MQQERILDWLQDCEREMPGATTLKRSIIILMKR